jgi:unspecific monooxygenase
MNVSQLPEGPNSPAWWQLIQWIGDPLRYLEVQAKRYGDIFTMRILGFAPIVIIGNPQAIQEIFAVDGKQFDAGRSNGIARFLVGDNSLLLLDGDRHRRQRKLLMPPFHGERLQAYAQLICDITEKATSRWVVGQPFVMRATMQEITLEAILQAVFGLRGGDRYQQLKPLLASMLDTMSSPLRSSVLFLKILQQDLGSWSPWGWMKRRKQKIEALLQAEIDERRLRSALRGAQSQNEQTGNDVLSLMLSARDEEGQPMTDAELRDELVTLLFAGHETTATALAWAFYCLHQQPEVKDKLLGEIETLGEHPDPLALSQLSYLTAVCQEVLRMYPVIPILFPRIAKSPIKIMGYEFEAQTILAPSIPLVHYREDLYPEPHEFKPERFLERQYSPAEYLPFGGGNRRCLGYAFALLEMKLVLATIMSRYHLALVDRQPVGSLRRGLTLAPAGGVGAIVQAKR